MTKELHDELVFVGYTNGVQILYASDNEFGGEGVFYKTTEHNCVIPLYMLKTHWHRLLSTSGGEVTLERIIAAQNVRIESQEACDHDWEDVGEYFSCTYECGATKSK